MPRFTQKYAIVQLFEDKPVGERFDSNSWPLHSTIIDTFAIDWDLPTMIEKLTDFLRANTQASSIVKDDRFLGENGQVQVALLNKTDDLIKLHYGTIELLEQGGLKLNDPQFAKEGFLPHSTVQSHSRLHKGNEVIFNTLSIIDFFPEKDPYQRKVLATIPIGEKIL